MKRHILILLGMISVFYQPVCADSLDHPLSKKTIVEQGIASWYGDDFHGKPTANGEVYDQWAFTAAHRSLPFGTQLIVENLKNGKYVMVRINDRGPYLKDRIIDLSKAAALHIDMVQAGTAHVRLLLALGDSSVINLTDVKNAHFAIQIASYNDLKFANAKADSLDGCYVVLTYLREQPIYRVYYGYFYEKETAIEMLAQLEAMGIKGIVRQIEND